MKIDELLKSNALLTQYVTKTLPEVSSLLQKSKFQATGKALLSLVARSGYINNEILFASGTGNLYACAVLFRPKGVRSADFFLRAASCVLCVLRKMRR